MAQSLSAIALLLASTAPAQTPDQALITQATRYLDALRSAHGRFVQADGAGRQQTGELWLQRPGRARFDYDKPSGVTIAANGAAVTIVDRRLKTLHRYPLAFTPLSIFLSDNLKFGSSVRILAVNPTAAGFAIAAADKRGKAKEQIVLDFARAPVRLLGWTLTDARGGRVQVRLTALAPSAPKPHSFFETSLPTATPDLPAQPG